jgi:hypothetical protein
MSEQQRPLREAMRIPGADSVTVISVTTRNQVWSRSVHRSNRDDTTVVAAVAIAAHAADLACLHDPDSQLDDLLVTTPRWFHLLRFTVGRDWDPQVVHLVLDRRVANLAMARIELKRLVVADRVVAGAVPPATEPAAKMKHPGQAGELPRREPGERAQRGSAVAAAPGAVDVADENVDHRLPGWFGLLAGEPFVTDTPTLDRLIEGLRELR